jgi:hypothetical protein
MGKPLTFFTVYDQLSRLNVNFPLRMRITERKKENAKEKIEKTAAVEDT